MAQHFTQIMRSGEMLPGEVTPDEIMCHDWARDEFARGLWCAFAPGFVGEGGSGGLGGREGRCWFASGDWADGWRGFIDGAIEQGCRVARQVVNEMDHTNRMACKIEGSSFEGDNVYG
jgi:monoamine oxidase